MEGSDGPSSLTARTYRDAKRKRRKWEVKNKNVGIFQSFTKRIQQSSTYNNSVREMRRGSDRIQRSIVFITSSSDRRLGAWEAAWSSSFSTSLRRVSNSACSACLPALRPDILEVLMLSKSLKNSISSRHWEISYNRVIYELSICKHTCLHVRV